MERETKIILGILAGVIVIGAGAGIGYYYYNKNKKGNGGNSGNGGNTNTNKGNSNNDDSTSGGDVPTSDEITSTEKLKNNDTVMKIGAYGKKVAILQAILNYKYGTNIVIDGKFGGETVKAVRSKIFPSCGIGATVAGVGVGDTECNVTKIYELLLIGLSKDPKFLKYMKEDKNAKKVFAKYQ